MEAMSTSSIHPSSPPRAPPVLLGYDTPSVVGEAPRSVLYRSSTVAGLPNGRPGRSVHWSLAPGCESECGAALRDRGDDGVIRRDGIRRSGSAISRVSRAAAQGWRSR